MKLKHPSGRGRPSAAAALLCAFLALLAGANLLVSTMEKKHGWRRDYSFNALTTQSETTLEVLAEMPHPVHIYALFSRGQEDAPLMELLDRYAAASDKVTWELADVSLNPSLLVRFHGPTAEESISNDSIVVWCEETDRYKVLLPTDFISLSLNEEEGAYEIAGLTYESSLTSAIRYVTQETVPRAMILQGHGELDANATGVLAALLDANNYDVIYFDFRTTETSLQPTDLLVMLSPQRDLTGDEMAVVTDFIDAGGSILFTCDVTDPAEDMPNWLSLLRSYGFLPESGLVIASAEESGTYYSGNRVYLIPSMRSTEITALLVDSGSDTLLLAGSRGFKMPAAGDNSLTVEAVLVSGEGAYLRALTDGRTSLDRQEGDQTGPFALALMARRITKTGNVSRAFVLGCSTLLTSSDVYAMTDSQEFIVRSTNWLVGQGPSDLGIIAKAAIRPQLSVQSLSAGSAVLVALPLAVLAAAVLVLVRRRKH